MLYEMVREIYNECSNNQMRDVFIEDVETDDTDEYVKRFLVGDKISCEKEILHDGTIVYHIDTDGMISCVTFTQA